ncbi:MAG: portal protein [Chloroflexi bacterium RBG_13_46_14]|nr:MAG: portal protein [Chloroflexi bacterium RBG_13_46_14]
MYIIIIGGGRVGYYLTKTLLDEGHEVLIVEKNANYCETINNELGTVCIQGDGCETATLAEVGTERADMLVAVTGEDQDNLVACQLAKHKFNVQRTIARIRNPQNEVLFKKLGVDVTVSSTNVILEYIEEDVPTHPLTHLLAIEDSGEEVVEIRIPPGAKTIGKLLRHLDIPEGSKLALVISTSKRTHIPTKNTVIKEGDRIIAITTQKEEKALRAALTGDQ